MLTQPTSKHVAVSSCRQDKAGACTRRPHEVHASRACCAKLSRYQIWRVEGVECRETASLPARQMSCRLRHLCGLTNPSQLRSSVCPSSGPSQQ